MSSASIETIQDRIDASGSSCDSVQQDQLQASIVDAAIAPAVATPTAPFPRLLDSSDVVVDPTGAELQRAATGITRASAAVTESGSIVLGDFGDGASLVSVFVDHHVAVVQETDIVDGIADVLATDDHGEANSCILATGPSATADMGALVEGAHGPADVHVIIVREDHQ